ncbi:hypothetical protein GOBAR_AA31092 [Gossypium barbadense]|uniref:Uncharacterized protein n=1 Tax=Gossypium barbadense TaxID=3634 RepID=A0A2P5WEV2_GOSBA|nr:hypothetical protein GOBAR_AA31092 [Gossypium barbadense]
MPSEKSDWWVNGDTVENQPRRGRTKRGRGQRLLMEVLLAWGHRGVGSSHAVPWKLKKGVKGGKVELNELGQIGVELS